MGAAVLQKFPYIKEYFAEANDVLQFDILDMCLNGPEEELNRTAHAQPAILILSYCAFQVMRRETGLSPSVLAGHSLGEISALCCSGAIRFPDAVRLVRKRGELMQRAVGAGAGAMLAISGLSVRGVQELCDAALPSGCAVISNINSRSQIVVSGDRSSVMAVGDRARESGAAVVPLHVSAPFHSPLMKPVAIDFETVLTAYEYSPLTYPVIANVTCRPYLDEQDIIPLLTEQLTAPVNWLKIMRYLRRTSVTAALELPPKHTLTKFFKSEDSPITAYTFDQFDEIQHMLRTGARQAPSR